MTMTTLFAARHGRGALESVPRMSEEMIMTTSVGITPPTMSMGMMADPLERMMPSHDTACTHVKKSKSLYQKTL